MIRKIEFYGEENLKYRRGILHERTKLSRVARELESHGQRFFSYEITKHSVKFDIPKAATEVESCFLV